MRSVVVTPSVTIMPGGRLDRAISTPSSGCRRMTGAGAMGVSFVRMRQHTRPHPEEQASACVSKDGRECHRGLMVRDGASRLLTMRVSSNVRFVRLPAGLLAGLVDRQ